MTIILQLFIYVVVNELKKLIKMFYHGFNHATGHKVSMNFKGIDPGFFST
jgi:hypothetical protein